jgi:hypothetical protein
MLGTLNSRFVFFLSVSLMVLVLLLLFLGVIPFLLATAADSAPGRDGATADFALVVAFNVPEGHAGRQ